jgi:hypothetical protein
MLILARILKDTDTGRKLLLARILRDAENSKGFKRCG